MIFIRVLAFIITSLLLITLLVSNKEKKLEPYNPKKNPMKAKEVKKPTYPLLDILCEDIEISSFRGHLTTGEGFYRLTDPDTDVKYYLPIRSCMIIQDPRKESK